MGDPKIAVGLQIGTQPPLGTVRAFALFARFARLESVMAVDHLQNIFPTAIWDEEFSWLAAKRPTPHEHFDYQVFLGYLASQVGKLRLGVGVTEPIRRHPVLIAQAMLTLSHMTKRAVLNHLRHLVTAEVRGKGVSGMPSWRALMMRWNKAHPKMAYDSERLFHRDFFRTPRSVVRPFGSKQGPDSDEGAQEPWESDQETLFAEREGQADVGGVYNYTAVRPPPPKLYRGG